MRRFFIVLLFVPAVFGACGGGEEPPPKPEYTFELLGVRDFIVRQDDFDGAVDFGPFNLRLSYDTIPENGAYSDVVIHIDEGDSPLISFECEATFPESLDEAPAEADAEVVCMEMTTRTIGSVCDAENPTIYASLTFEGETRKSERRELPVECFE